MTGAEVFEANGADVRGEVVVHVLAVRLQRRRAQTVALLTVEPLGEEHADRLPAVVGDHALRGGVHELS
ncbi:MAG: hypothetical protein ABJA87_13255 [bacterium]